MNIFAYLRPRPIRSSIPQHESLWPHVRAHRRRLLGRAALFLSALSVLSVATPAFAIPADEGKQLYREDFEGEFTAASSPISFGPTTPEVDFFEEGGMVGQGFDGLGDPIYPELTGSAVRLLLDPANGDRFMNLFGFASRLGTATHSLRAAYNGLVINPAVAIESGVTLTSQYIEPATFDFYSVGAGVAWDPVTTQLRFFVRESSEVSFVLATNEVEAILGTTLTPLAGEIFTIDVQIDRDANLITGTLIVDGGATTTLSVPITLIGNRPFDLFRTTLVAPGAIGGVMSEVSVDEFEAYIPYTSDFTVTSRFDNVDATLGDGVCADASGGCTLRAAVQESNTIPGMSRIVFDPLPGPVVLSNTGAGEDAAATGDLDVLRAADFVGRGSDATRIEGNHTDRIFHVPASAEGTPVFLADMSLRNGWVPTGAGGAIDSWGLLVIDRSIVEDNEANIGGGLANRRQMSVRDSIIRENHAAEAGGISAPAAGAQGTNEFFELRRSAVVDNTALGTFGGGEVYDATEAIVWNSTFSGNSGTQFGTTDTEAEFQHATIVGGAGTGLEVVSTGSASAFYRVSMFNSAFSGTPACVLAPAGVGMLNYTKLGISASNDTSCDLAASGGLEGTPLDLGPLVSHRGTIGHVPTAGGNLIDATPDPLVATSYCRSPIDQSGTIKPQDGDGDGNRICDIGAIERPAPVGSLTSIIWIGPLELVPTNLGSGLFAAGTPGVSPFEGYFVLPEACAGDCIGVPFAPTGTAYDVIAPAGGIRAVGEYAAAIENRVEIANDFILDDGIVDIASQLGVFLQQGAPFDAWQLTSKSAPDGTPGQITWSLIHVYVSTDPFQSTEYTIDPPQGADLMAFIVTEEDGTTIYQGFGNVTSVPEPGMGLLLGVGVSGLTVLAGGHRRKRRLRS